MVGMAVRVDDSGDLGAVDAGGIEIVGELEHFLRDGECVAARRRQLGATPATLEEPHAKVFLELLDARRDGGLSEMLVTCSRVKSAQSRNPVKGFDLLQGNAHDRSSLSVSFTNFDYLPSNLTLYS